MPERATGNQATQIGVEVTPGTSVAANRKLKSIGIQLNPAGEVNVFRPQGSKLPTVLSVGKEWSAGSIAGQPVYDELSYLLASVIDTSVDTVVNTTGQQHVYTLSAEAPDTGKTFTLEQGDSVRAGKATHLQVVDLSMEFSRAGVSVSGACIAQRYQDAITMTASPTVLPQIPLLPTEVDIFLDPTFGAIGTTKYLRAFRAVLDLTGRYQAIWPLNSALTSFATTIEGAAPDARITLQLAADAVGMAFLTALRAGTTQYLRLKSTGPVIGAGPAVYSLQVDAAVKVADFAGFEDADGVYAIPWPLQIVSDTSLSLTVTLVNATAAL